MNEPVVNSMGRRLLQRRNGRLTDEEVLRALDQCDGHRARAAQRLGVSERTLYRYVERLREKVPGIKLA